MASGLQKGDGDTDECRHNQGESRLLGDKDRVTSKSGEVRGVLFKVGLTNDQRRPFMQQIEGEPSKYAKV